MKPLTRNEILEDITAFEERIKTAREKLAMLPVGRLRFKDHKKREVSRKVYLDEIRHVERLKSYAVEALADK